MQRTTAGGQATVAIRLGLDDAPTTHPGPHRPGRRGRRHAAQPEHGPSDRAGRRRTGGRRDRARGRRPVRGRPDRGRSGDLPGLRSQGLTRSLERVFGKRVIVVGGGAQVAQVALGAVSEADRHNLRGEKISVDTIPLVGEENIAAAVRAVADLPRARLLVLAGSIMGGDITRGRSELRAHGIPIIALNMVGSITERGRPRRVGPGPGRDDGGDGRRGHGDVRPRRASAAGGSVLRTTRMRIATWNVNSLKARQEEVEQLARAGRRRTSCSCRRPSWATTTRR